MHLGVFYVSTARAYLANPPATGPKTIEIIKTEEKGSDVALATYLILDACRSDCDTAVLITNELPPQIIDSSGRKITKPADW